MSKMSTLIDKITKKKIIVIGDLMLDRYYEGVVSRISPEAPIPVLKHRATRNILGGAGNVASNLIASNQEVRVISSVGKDEAGDAVCELLSQINVDISSIMRYEKRTTTLKSRYVSGNQQLLRMDDEQIDLLDFLEKEFIVQKFESELADSSAIILSDYAKGVLTEELCNYICRMAEKKQIPVLIDVKENNHNKYQNAYLIKPNKKELELLYGHTICSEKELKYAMTAIKAATQCRELLVTLGAEGMVLLTEEDNFYSVRAQAKRVYDVVGAGDTAIAYLAVGIANHFSDEEYLKLANAAASVKVTKSGTAPVGLTEVGNLWDGMQNSKLVSRKELQGLLAHQNGKIIVFTNGCFDILHAGHISYLRQARELGDILIIGLNSDASVRRLKGHSRPVNGQWDRAAVLAGLEFVDYIVIFDEDTPLELIREVNPNILVKGADYTNKTVVGKEYVEARGGQVILLDFLEGRSTTRIIDEIRKSEG